MVQNNTTTEYDYEIPGPYMTNQFASEYDMREALKYMYMGMYSIIILLGLPLNTLVIYMIFCKMKRTGGAIWFLGLAVTDLTVCLFLPFQIVSALDDFNWRFGWVLCKFCSFVMFVNMHSTALMLSFMSMDRCLSALVSHACCKSFVSKSMVLLSWTIGTLLSIPSLLFRSVKDTDNGQSCSDDYKSTAEGKEKLHSVTFTRLFFGLLLPLFVIAIGSCFVSMKRNSVQIKASKSYRIIRAIIIAYFLCWIPYHTLMVVALVQSSRELFTVGLPISTVLAGLNSCVNPIICILMGRSISMNWMEDAFFTNRQTTGQAAPETTGEETQLAEIKRHQEEKDL